MKEPTFDQDGYPTEETLQAIRLWPYTDLVGLVRFVGDAWCHPDCWKQTGRQIEAHTIGWSGNESLISALQGNPMFWMMCWVSSKRGGHYTFELPDGEDGA